LRSIGRKHVVSRILRKDLPLYVYLGNEEKSQNLTTIIKLLHSKIPVSIDQQRIVELFPFTEENLENLKHVIHHLTTARKK